MFALDIWNTWPLLGAYQQIERRFYLKRHFVPHIVLLSNYSLYHFTRQTNVA